MTATMIEKVVGETGEDGEMIEKMIVEALC
jgi:hypothetical protein